MKDSQMLVPDKSRESNTHYTPIWLGLLTLLTVSSLGYTLYANGQLRTETQHETHILTADLLELKQHQTATQDQLQTEQTALQSTETSLRTALDGLNTQLQSAISPSTEVSNHWLLLKARYAIELAQLNAYWSSDRTATMALLKQADNLIAQHQGPQLFTVRQALAHDIAAQETAPTLDQAGLLSQLDALQQQITTRPFKHAPPRAIEDRATSQTPNIPASWHERLHACVRLLQQLFVVRYHPDPLQPLLTPAYKALQRETIRLSLQEVQWAILQRNEAVYQLALKQALHNIQRAFGKNNASTQPILNQLERLASIAVQETKIIPEESLTTLNQVMDTLSSPSPQTGAIEP